MVDSSPRHLARNLLDGGLIAPGAALLVAVSGGLDSMVLLHLLAGAAREQQWKITIGHFNHCLRGRSSDADERLVRKTAADLGLPVVVGRGDVKKVAVTKGISIEMAARELRHGFLARTAREHRIARIALAHHADDQVELFFLRLLRGAGSEGLSGMKEVSPSPADAGVKLVRPLLHESRAALEAYAKANKVRFREDASNSSLDFARNRIRHKLLPVLRAQQPALNATILRSIEILAAESELAGELASAFLASDNGSFGQLHMAVQRRVLQSRLRELGLPAEFDLIEKLRLQPDQPIMVIPGTQVTRGVRGEILVRKIDRPTTPDLPLELDLSTSGAAAFGTVRFVWKIEKCQGKKLLPEQNCEFFDAKKVGTKAVLRTWQPGDRFQPIGMASAIKLQDLFTNAKVPRAERCRRVVALNADGLVFWVQGLRISETFKLDTGTQHRLKWCWSQSEPAVAGDTSPC